MRSPSACSSISSQTQPQKVQVAFLTTVRLILCFSGFVSIYRFAFERIFRARNDKSIIPLITLFVRTGRNHERSAQFPAEATPPDAARLVTAEFDHFPGLSFTGR